MFGGKRDLTDLEGFPRREQRHGLQGVDHIPFTEHREAVALTHFGGVEKDRKGDPSRRVVHEHGQLRAIPFQDRQRADMVAVGVGDDQRLGRVLFKSSSLGRLFSASKPGCTPQSMRMRVLPSS